MFSDDGLKAALAIGALLMRDFPFQFAVRPFSSVIALGDNDMPMSFGCQAISAPRGPTIASLSEAAALASSR